MTLSDEQRVLRAKAASEIAHPLPGVTAALAALDVRPGMRVLDAGCGPGVHLGLFAAAVPPGGAVVGLDLDPDSLAVAADLWSAEVSRGEITIEGGDVTALPYPPGAFDFVWTSFVLHHVPDPAAALREFVRTVVPGGHVAVHDADIGTSFPALPWPPDLEDRLRAAVWRAALDGYGGELPYFYDPFFGRKLPGLLRAAGLAEVQLRAIPAVHQAPLRPDEAAELRTWFREWFDGRLRPYLAPRDLAALQALFDPENPADLLADSGFFVSRTWLLATGRVAPA